MEENHINLYHDISKQDVEKYVTSLKDFNNLNSVGFDREMLKFFALFKDAHTNYFVPYENMNRKIVYI